MGDPKATVGRSVGRSVGGTDELEWTSWTMVAESADAELLGHYSNCILDFLDGAWLGAKSRHIKLVFRAL